MTERRASIHVIRDAADGQFAQPLVGEIHHVDESGSAHVIFPGCHGVPVRARSTVATPWRAGERPEDLAGAPVLIVLEESDPTRPIVVGLLRDGVKPEAIREELHLDLTRERDVLVDGQRLVFDAQEEVQIRCGKSTIVMQPDGKIVIRGTNLISRSSGANKIKGARINLN